MTPSRQLSDKEFEIVMEHVEDRIARARIIGGHFFALHKETPISIRVPVHELRKNANSYKIVKGKACIEKETDKSNNLQVDCFVACSKHHIGRLPPTANEVDIIQHLDTLLPQTNSDKIQLVTCQNGIQNSLDKSESDRDFYNMCTSITKKIKTKTPLFIGLYNPTSGKGFGFPQDLERLGDPWALNTCSIMTLRQLFFTLSDKLAQKAAKHLWLHIAHSEAGRLAQNCLTDHSRGLSSSKIKQIKKHLITLVFGGVSPVSPGTCKKEINVYSNKDITINILNKGKLDKPLKDITLFPYTSKTNKFTIEIVECIVKKPSFPEGDHAFLGETYQKALKNHLTKLKLI